MLSCEHRVLNPPATVYKTIATAPILSDHRGAHREDKTASIRLSLRSSTTEKEEIIHGISKR